MKFALFISILLSVCGCSSVALNPVSKSNASIELPANFSAVEQAALGRHTADLTSWWLRFNDLALNHFLELALRDNLDYQLSLARIETARANLSGLVLNQLPSLALDANATYARRSEFDPQARNLPPTSNLSGSSFRAAVSIDWDLDLFGRKKAQIQTREARLAATEFEAQAVRLLIATEVAKFVSQARSLQERKPLLDALIELEVDSEAILKAKRRAGQINETQILAVQSRRQEVQQIRLQDDIELSKIIDSLAVLTMTTRTEIFDALNNLKSGKPLVQMNTVGTPADLLRRRPDIQQRENLLAATILDTAALETERTPTFTLTAIIGSLANTLVRIGSVGSLITSFGPSLNWQPFDFGRLDSTIAASKSNEKEALLRYRQALATSFIEADSALTEFEQRKRALDNQQALVDGDNELIAISLSLYKAGQTDLLPVMDRQRNRLNRQLSLVQIKQAHWQNIVQVYKALGGGW
jgi:NodT family efflux transporter outer membrane factor (OMF) lipoprotein